MSGSDKKFNAAKKRVVQINKEPDLFKLAEAALSDRHARGMLVYEDKLWMVATRAVKGRLTIWPEIT